MNKNETVTVTQTQCDCIKKVFVHVMLSNINTIEQFTTELLTTDLIPAARFPGRYCPQPFSALRGLNQIWGGHTQIIGKHFKFTYHIY